MSKDTIYREDAIKAIEELRKEPHWLHDGDDYRVCGLSEAEDAIERLPSVDRPQEWIPCSERLPKSHGYYICTCKDGSKYKRASAVKWSNGWQLTGARAYWIVLAWMPLPEPWKGADDE